MSLNLTVNSSRTGPNTGTENIEYIDNPMVLENDNLTDIGQQEPIQNHSEKNQKNT